MASDIDGASDRQVFDPFRPDCFMVGRAPDGGLRITKRFGDLSEIALCVPPIYLQHFFGPMAEVLLQARADRLIAVPEARHGN